MKKFSAVAALLIGFLFLHSVSLHASNGPDGAYDITFKVKGLKEGDECLLAYYLGSKNYIKDTLTADKNGVVRFQGEGEDGPEYGIYLFVFPDKNYFEFILTEDKFTLETEMSDPVNKMKVSSSPENTAFFSYLQMVAPYQEKAGKLNQELRGDVDEKRKTELTDQLNELNEEAGAAREKFISEHEGLFVTKVFAASAEPEIPEYTTEDGQPDYARRLAYLRAHYWDKIDFSDDRMLRTPILEQRIKDFMNKYTVQHYDSALVSADVLLNLAIEGEDQEVLRFVTITLSNMFGGSKKMCYDKVYVHVLEKVYMSDRAWWADSTKMVKIKDRYYKMKYNTCGSPAPNLLIPDVSGNMRQVYETKTPFTILYFWAYDCGHCKKVTPKMLDFYRDYKDHVSIFAISTKKELDPWKESIEEKGIQEFINVADPEHKSNFRVFYDIYSTPVIYVLDKDKKIVAKRLDVLSLRKYLNFELGLDIPIPEDLKPDKEMSGSKKVED